MGMATCNKWKYRYPCQETNILTQYNRTKRRQELPKWDTGVNNPLDDNIYPSPQNKVRNPEPGEPLKIEVQDYKYVKDLSTIKWNKSKRKGQNDKEELAIYQAI